jgi:hypothetical protein
MAIRLRRGLNADRTTITPEPGEPLWTTDTKKLYIGDGATPGGNPVGGGTGDVVGPSSSVDNRVVLFNGTTGKLIKDSGLTLSPAALTRFNDTNVTLTLGGTPATSLLAATSLTLGWTGELSTSRGGTGLATLGTSNQLIRVNSGATALEYFTPSYITTAVTSVATAGLISGGTITGAGTITTSMSTGKLVGRSTASTGIMEEIAIGTGLTLSSGVLSNSATYTSPLTTKGDIFVRSTVDTRLPIGTDGQILTANSSVTEGLSWQDNYADWTSVVKHTVKNNGLSGTITKGTAVYVTGSNGTNMLVGRASNTSEATSSKTMGLMQSDITTTGSTQTGFVVTEGLLGGLNTAGTTAGDPVWLGVSGALIYGLINKPYAPAHLVFIGIVTKVSAGSGEIFVKVQNGFELKEIHDVDIITTTPINGHILGFDGTLWVNKTIAGWLGFTPGTVTSVTGTTPIVSSGGTAPAISIPAATTSVDGYLTAANWTTFNGKQNALSGTGLVKSTAGTITYITDNSTNWDTAYTERNKWDGGSTGLVAATGRISLGATTLGSNLFTITNPSAITFPRYNADNTVSALDASTFRTAIGAGTSSTTGTVTSVTGTAPVSVATGTSTPVISLASGYGDTQNPYTSKTANYILAAPNGTAGVPTFRAIVAADIPTLNQSTTGNAATVTTNANLTGPVTSTGNATAIANGAISNAMLANGAVASLSGTNTGDQTITLSGDVTGSGTGSFSATIANGAVSLAKMANLAAHTIIGNNTGTSATPLALSGTQVTAMLDSFNGTTKGLVPVPSGPGTNVFLAADSTWQKIATSAIVDQSGKTLIANTSASAGAVSAVAISSITTELTNLVGDSGSGGTKGLVPAPASGDATAGKFLKADGTWAVPAGGGGGGGTTTNPLIIKADSGTTEGTDLYTFDGSSAKTINIVAGTNITITKTAGTLTISSTGGSSDNPVTLMTAFLNYT